jgi:hypothetical protein
MTPHHQNLTGQAAAFLPSLPLQTQQHAAQPYCYRQTLAQGPQQLLLHLQRTRRRC